MLHISPQRRPTAALLVKHPWVNSHATNDFPQQCQSIINHNSSSIPAETVGLKEAVAATFRAIATSPQIAHLGPVAKSELARRRFRDKALNRVQEEARKEFWNRWICYFKCDNLLNGTVRCLRILKVIWYNWMFKSLYPFQMAIYWLVNLTTPSMNLQNILSLKKYDDSRCPVSNCQQNFETLQSWILCQSVLTITSIYLLFRQSRLKIFMNMELRYMR